MYVMPYFFKQKGNVKMSESKISLEVAKDQMQEFLDYYDIDQDDIVVEQGPEAIETILNRLVRAIQKGHLEIQDNGTKVIQNLKFPMGDVTQITYGVLTQKNKYAMEGISDKKPIARMNALMGSLAGVPGNAFMNLKGVDLSVMERLATLFMVV